MSRYKTNKGRKKRIEILRMRIEKFKMMRGDGEEGTIWNNLDTVDKWILEEEQEILELTRELTQPKFNEELLNQLKASEIF